MNCEKCQQLLSDFLDGSLAGEDQSLIDKHLEECAPCFAVREDLNSIISFCQQHRGEYETPPHAHALWVRIRNTLEIGNGAPSYAQGQRPAASQPVGWWSRLMHRSWELSLAQMAATVSAIALAVALATAFSLTSLKDRAPGADNLSTQRVAPRMALAGPDDRMRQQQLAIDYWNQRVEQRKVRWSPQIRDAFERNMQVLDQTVEDSRQVLSQNPHDEVYEEMLNTALNDKMELLKEFSDM
ncbi:MAG TPA: zf-HC2 domain-containing protein [Pyrinomonadaceae bacterium]|jgi:hypothetical protein